MAQGGPKLLWKLDGLGRGFSTVSIVGGKFYTMGDRKAGEDEGQFVLAYDLATARSLGHPDRPAYRRRRAAMHAHGRRRAALRHRHRGRPGVPRDGQRQDRVAEELRQGFRRQDDVHVEVSRVAPGRRREARLHPGGKDATIVALDKKTGESIWKCAVPQLGSRGKDGAGYTSMVAAEIDGVRQYVQIIGRGAIGVDAETGKFLWGYNRIANGVANIPTPMVRGDYVFVTTSYKTGSALLEPAHGATP